MTSTRQMRCHVDDETGDRIFAELQDIEAGVDSLDVSSVKFRCQDIRSHLKQAGYVAGQRCEFCRGVGNYLEPNDDRETETKHVCMMCLGSGRIRVRIETAAVAS